MGVWTDLTKPQDVPRNYRLEARDTELSLVSLPLLPKQLHRRDQVLTLVSGTRGDGALGVDMGLPVSSQVVRSPGLNPHPLLRGVLSTQALEDWTPQACLPQLSNTGSRPLRPRGPQPTQAHTLAGSHWRKTEGRLMSQGAQAGEPDQDKGRRSASGPKASRGPWTDRLPAAGTTGSGPLTPPQPAAQSQAGGHVLPKKTRRLPGQLTLSSF